MSDTALSFEMMQDYPPSIAAAEKLAPIADDFCFYSFEWLGDKPEEWTVMKVQGAVFRPAKTGPNKGKRTVMVKGTERTAYVTAEEIEAVKRRAVTAGVTG